MNISWVFALSTLKYRFFLGLIPKKLTFSVIFDKIILKSGTMVRYHTVIAVSINNIQNVFVWYALSALKYKFSES